jgi:hypothetical protein
LRFFGIVAIAAIASGGEKKWRRMMMGSSILESFVR